MKFGMWWKPFGMGQAMDALQVRAHLAGVPYRELLELVDCGDLRFSGIDEDGAAVLTKP